MIARIQKRLQEKAEGAEKGFTLVELLVVIIIIGILAAIAIPLYLNQQAKAKDSALQSDLKNGQIAVASALADDPTGATMPTASELSKSPGVSISAPAINVASGTFCIGGTVSGGKVGAYSIDQDGDLTSGATC